MNYLLIALISFISYALYYLILGAFNDKYGMPIWRAYVASLIMYACGYAVALF